MNFWDIYDSHYARVRKFIRSLVGNDWVADDLIQETFIKIQQNLHQLKDPAKLTSWIYRIAYNLCQDHFRKAGRRLEKNEACAEPPLVQIEPVFQKKYEQHQMGACVQDKMKLLPESYRTVLTLFDLMELSHKEIAEVLDISVENVKVRLHRARKKLKVILEENCRFEVDERNVLVCTPAEDQT